MSGYPDNFLYLTTTKEGHFRPISPFMPTDKIYDDDDDDDEIALFSLWDAHVYPLEALLGDWYSQVIIILITALFPVSNT